MSRRFLATRLGLTKNLYGGVGNLLLQVPSASFGLADRATCPVCTRSMPLTKGGGIRVHGPLSNRCTGSGMRLVPQALNNSCSIEPLSPLVANDSPPELIFSADIRRNTRIFEANSTSSSSSCCYEVGRRAGRCNEQKRQ